MNKKPVCIYVDNSNIYIGAKETAKERKEESASLRIAFNHFLFLITHGQMEFDEMYGREAALRKWKNCSKA